MKSSRPFPAALLSLAAMILAPAWLLCADDALPKAPPAGRYELMAARSPFTAPTVALPTPTPAPTLVGPHWWDQMSVSSLMEVGGVYFAAVVDKANNKRYVLESGKPDEDSHLLLTEVQWNERADQSTVTVRKGAEIAPPLRFDASAAPSTSASPQQPFNAPRIPPNFGNPPPLPPGFTGTPPPPPPPATSVVRRNGPIASRPPTQPIPGTGALPAPPNAPPVRRVRPLGGNNESDD